MTWLTWRQFRTQAIAAAAILAVLAVLLAVTGPHMARLYDSSGIATCTGCQLPAAQQHLRQRARPGSTPSFTSSASGSCSLVPGHHRVFWGAPLITREIEAAPSR